MCVRKREKKEERTNLKINFCNLISSDDYFGKIVFKIHSSRKKTFHVEYHCMVKIYYNYFLFTKLVYNWEFDKCDIYNGKYVTNNWKLVFHVLLFFFSIVLLSLLILFR